ncbi:MAG: AzlD domain-containing protein [Pseudonocardia sp.]|nr:AzlD domain-containing protein [Pseudonocardia sp.]
MSELASESSAHGVVLLAAVLLAVGVLSWAFRVAAITLLPAARLPERARRLLEHAAPAAIAAMVGTGIAGGAALPELASRLPFLVAAAVTAVLAWRTRGLVLPVVAGLAAAWVVAAL